MFIDVVANSGSRVVRHPVSNTDLYPLVAFRKQLRERDVQFKFIDFNTIDRKTNSEALLIHSRVFCPNDDFVSAIDIERIKIARNKYKKIIWFDGRDSAGNTQFEVLPFVDTYIKKQLYRDYDYYRKQLCENRLQSHLMLADKERSNEPFGTKYSTPLNRLHEKKLQLGWNIGYSDIWAKTAFHRYTRLFFGGEYTKPKNLDMTHRKIDVHARFTTKYDSFATTEHRKSLERSMSLLSNKGWDIRVGKVEKKQYIFEQHNSRITLSPFGYGEVCFRDFEAVLNCSVLAKPSMEHLVTFPDIYHANETYFALSWEASEAAEQIDELLSNKRKMSRIANEGQSLYLDAWSPNGISTFCSRVSSLFD